jgi:hypothetical protein
LSPSDVEHIEAMIAKGLVPHMPWSRAFREAADYFSLDARAEEELPKYIANLHRVERDVYGSAPTEVELPSWFE